MFLDETDDAANQAAPTATPVDETAPEVTPGEAAAE